MRSWRPGGPAVVLAALWLVIGAVNAAWLRQDTRPPTWDPSNHLLSSVRYRHALSDFAKGRAGAGATATRILRVDDHYPPLAPLVAAALTAPWKPAPDPSILVLGQLSLALLLFAVLAIGRDLFSPAAGAAAAILVATFPLVSGQSRQFMLDLPDAAMTSLCLLALLRSRRFEKAGPSLAFGAIFGLALLTKWTCAFFVAAPAAGALFTGLRAPGFRKRARHALSAAFAASTIAFPWYAAHLWGLLRDSTKFAYDVGVREGDPAVRSLASLIFYPARLNGAILLPALALLVTGAILILARRDARGFLPMLWILGGTVILTLIRNKDARYVIPMLPAVALVAAVPLARLRLTVACLAASAVGALGLVTAWRREPPVREQWPIPEAVDFVRLSSPGNSRPRLRVIPDVPFFERHAFEYAAEASGEPIPVSTWFRFPSFTDFVLTKTGAQGDRPEPSALMREIDDPRAPFASLFRLRWERPLPDGSVARIYAREIVPVEAEAGEVVRRLQAAIAAELASRAAAIEDPNVAVETLSDDATRRGAFRSITISARSLRLLLGRKGAGSLLLHDLSLRCVSVSIDPHTLMREGKLRLLTVEEVVPRLRVSESDVNTLLAPGSSGVSGAVRFAGGRIEASNVTPRHGPPIDASLEPKIVDGNNIRVDIRRLRVAGVPLPATIGQAIVSGNNPVLKPMPCRLRLNDLRVDGGSLSVNESAGGPPR